MNRYTLAKDYIEIATSDETALKEDYRTALERMAESTAIYKGEPIPFLHQPMFFTETELAGFDDLTSKLVVILNKVIDRYVHNAEFRKKFGYSQLLEELVMVEPLYHVNVPVARFDIFMHEDGRFKFCELNADGASGMNETNELDRVFLQSELTKKMGEHYDIDYMELVESWVTCSMDIYHRHPDAIERPNIAIIDWKGGGTAIEFEEFRKAYERKGYHAVIADPRDVIYQNGVLSYEGTPIHMVYRRLVTGEMMTRQGEIPDFIAACKDNSICMIGSVRSQIIHNKIVFKILHDEDTKEYLTEEERQYIADHIPWTVDFAGDCELYQKCLKEKDSFILKPRDLYAAHGVYAGADHNDDVWEEIAQKCFDNGYILQEFYPPPTMPMVTVGDDVTVDDYKNIIGLYMYDERFAGIYNRVSRNNVIASIHGSVNVASFKAVPKD